MLFPTCPSGILLFALMAGLETNATGVPGKVFDRFVTIWLENTDFEKALKDPNFEFLQTKGITLTNFFAITHPIEPNYIASVGGEYFGLDADKTVSLPQNVATVVDLLEDKGINWSEYMEDMPSIRFLGSDSPNGVAKAYVRKHNSVTNRPNRLQQIKPLTSFFAELQQNKLPQWMFITPIMSMYQYQTTNLRKGRHTSMSVAGEFSRPFIEPLLSNPNFMQKTLMLLTFDENKSLLQPNRVASILVGDAVPDYLRGTTDTNRHSHYFGISTVEAN